MFHLMLLLIHRAKVGVALTWIGFVPQSAGCVTLPRSGPSDSSARAHFDPIDPVTCYLPHRCHGGLAVVIKPRGQMKKVTYAARLCNRPIKCTVCNQLQGTEECTHQA